MSTKTILQLSVPERKKKSDNLRQSNPERIPILLIAVNESWDFPMLLINKNLSFLDILKFLKKQVDVRPNHSITMSCSNRIISPDKIVKVIDELDKSEDGFLNVKVMTVETNGGFLQ